MHVHGFACEPIAKADKAKLSEIEALAEKLEPALARALRDMLRDYAEAVPLDDLAEAIGAGDVARVLGIVGQIDAAGAARARTELENAVWAGGALATQAPVFAEARFAFNRLNPALVNWLEGYSLNLIREVNQGTVEAVRAVLVKGMTAGANPIDQARAVKAVVGLTARQAGAVANYRRALETFHLRRSAKRWGLGNQRARLSGVAVAPRDKKTGKLLDGIEEWRLRDLRFDPALETAMRTKTPLKPEQIDKMVARYAERMRQNRARTIARTESIRAVSAGANEAWRQAIASGKVDGALVRKFWNTSRDERECEVCEAIAAAVPKRGVPFDAYFENPKGEAPLKLTPAHPSCRCWNSYRLFEPSQLQEP